MKTIGLIGGMSWESTVTYYQVINETIREELGGLHSAKILMYSVDFDEIEKCQSSGDWKRSADILSDAAMRLECAGADFIVICTNTMHKVAPEVRESISIPLLHIAEVTAWKLKEAGIRDSVKVIVGGGPISQRFADQIGADGYSDTAVDAVKLAKNLLGIE